MNEKLMDIQQIIDFFLKEKHFSRRIGQKFTRTATPKNLGLSQF